MDPRSAPGFGGTAWEITPLTPMPKLTALFSEPKQSADVIDMAAWRAEHGK